MRESRLQPDVIREEDLTDDSEVRVCARCRRRLAKDCEGKLCYACADQELFLQVRDYIRANDVKDYQVAEHFGIPLSRVKRWIREGRIQYRNEKTPREVIMTNYCQICGKPTAFGSICTECMQERKRKQMKGVAVGHPNSGEHNKMRFLEGDDDR